jgi:hypothetical protein
VFDRMLERTVVYVGAIVAEKFTELSADT